MIIKVMFSDGSDFYIGNIKTFTTSKEWHENQACGNNVTIYPSRVMISGIYKSGEEFLLGFDTFIDPKNSEPTIVTSEENRTAIFLLEEGKTVDKIF